MFINFNHIKIRSSIKYIKSYKIIHKITLFIINYLININNDNSCLKMQRNINYIFLYCILFMTGFYY